MNVVSQLEKYNKVIFSKIKKKERKKVSKKGRKWRVSNFVVRIGVASVSRAQAVVTGHLVKHRNETLTQEMDQGLK